MGTANTAAGTRYSPGRRGGGRRRSHPVCARGSASGTGGGFLCTIRSGPVDGVTQEHIGAAVIVLDEDAVVPIPPGRLIDADPRLQARQRAFRARVLQAGVMAGTFSSPEQLEVLLLQALQDSRPQAPVPAGAGGAVGLPPRPDLPPRTCRSERSRFAKTKSAAAKSAWRSPGPEIWRVGRICPAFRNSLM